MSSDPDDSDRRIIKLPSSIFFVLNCSSKLVINALTYPVDTVKTRLQSHEGFWKSGGFRNIYRGIVPSSLGCYSTTAVSVLLLNTASQPNLSSQYSYSELITFGVGLILRGMAEPFVQVPFEVLKQRRQTGGPRSRDLARQAFRTEGVFGLYRGFCSTVLLDCAMMAVTIPVVHCLKLLYTEQTRRELDQYETLSCVILGGGIAAFLTTPLDLGKTRIMLHRLSENDITGSPSRTVPSLISTLRTVFYEQGVRGLFAGAIPRIVASPLKIITFGVQASAKM